MKNKAGVFGLSLLFLVTLSGILFSNQRPNLRIYGGISLPQEGQIKSGLSSGFGFSLPLTKSFLFQLDFGYWKCQVESRPGRLYEGELFFAPLLFSFHFIARISGILKPYVFIGSGYAFNHFKMGSYVSIPEVTIDQSIQNGFLIQGGAGMALSMAKRLDAFFELDYLYREGKGKTTFSDMNLGIFQEEFSLNLSSLGVKIGIKYLF